MILIPDLQQRMRPFCCGALDTVEPCLLLGWDVLAPLPKGRQGKMSFQVSLFSSDRLCKNQLHTEGGEERCGTREIYPKNFSQCFIEKAKWDDVGSGRSKT